MTMRLARGFTLLEMLIAMMVFALLSLAGYRMLDGMLLSRQIGDQHSQQLADVQRALALMANDIRQARLSVERTNSGAPAWRGVMGGHGWLNSQDDGISLTRGGWINPGAAQTRSQLLRVGYLLHNQHLERLYFVHPDPLPGKAAAQQQLLSGVSAFKLRFYGDNGWQSSWQSAQQLPKAVEVTLTIKGIGEVRRIWLLAPGDAPVAPATQAQEDSSSDS